MTHWTEKWSPGWDSLHQHVPPALMDAILGMMAHLQVVGTDLWRSWKTGKHHRHAEKPAVTSANSAIAQELSHGASLISKGLALQG